MSLLLRIFRAVLLVLLALVIVIGVLVFVLLRRSYPEIEGTLTIPGLDDRVEIVRDSMGIPHIYASTQHDLFLAQGYVHAQDRFFQMDVWRHTGAGRTAEMLGSGNVETDIYLRTLGWARVSQVELDQSPPSLVESLEAYADGVNTYLVDHQGAKLSFEYVVLRLLSPSYTPDPWKPLDSMTLSKLLAYQLSGNYGGWADLERAKVLNQIGTSRGEEFFPPYPEDRPQIVPDPAFGDQSLNELADSIAGFFNIETRQSALLTGFENEIGSNNWVISGSRTDTGMPILANDPHLGIQLPAIWYEIGLHCTPVSEECPFNVTGFSLASAPGVVIGHNDRIAWGMTNVGPDVVDLFMEKINPENPNQYEVNGRWVDMDIIEEQISVAGGDPVPVTIRYTRHGPIVSELGEDFEDLAETTGLDVPSPYAVSLRWTGLDPARVFEAILGFDQAGDWDEFRAAAELFAAPAQNLVYADVEGNIGYQTPGLIPIRAGGDGLLPVPGWTDEYEWVDFIPFDELPTSFNPPQGYIVTANNAVVGSKYPYSISREWAPGYRAQRIVDLIQALDSVSIADVEAIQGDNYNAMGPVLIPFLDGLSFEDSETADLAESLARWDFQNGLDSQPAALFNAFWRQLVIDTFEDEVPENIPGVTHSFILFESMLAQPDHPWWDDRRTSEVETRDEILKMAFIDGIDELRKNLGRNSDSWTWGDLHTSTFRNQAGVGPLGLILNRGPYRTSGGPAIINATGWGIEEGYDVVSLPSMRMVVDLSDLRNSFTIHTTGQSGHATHPHYIDMAEMWSLIQYHPMRWTREQVDASAEGVLSLVPE